jgi:membrane fusion protein, multidrug efflux system
MRKSFILPAVAIILVILVSLKVIQGCRKDDRKKVNTATPLVQAECYLVRDTIIEFPLRAVGYLRANEAVEVVSELSERVSSIFFKEGSFVKKGDLLFQLDDSEYKADLKKNNAQLELAIREEARNADLLESGGISRQVYDESVSHRKVLEAEGDVLRVFIEKARIKAPFSGKAGIRNVSEGAYVVPGEVLTSLEDLSTLEIDFTVPQDQAATVRVGNPLRFRTSGNPAEHLAVVEACDPSIDRKTGNLRVLARVESAKSSLIPGTAITVNMVNKGDVPALFVPSQALLPTPAGYNIYRVVDGKCIKKPVSTGLRLKDMIEIKEGVTRGDTILLTGFMKVKPGNKVRIIKTW